MPRGSRTALSTGKAAPRSRVRGRVQLLARASLPTCNGPQHRLHIHAALTHTAAWALPFRYQLWCFIIIAPVACGPRPCHCTTHTPASYPQRRMEHRSPNLGLQPTSKLASPTDCKDTYNLSDSASCTPGNRTPSPCLGKGVQFEASAASKRHKGTAPKRRARP